MELCPFSLDFQSRTTVKSQALVDFIAEWTDLNEPPPLDTSDHWSMFFDGSLNINSASAGILFVLPNKDKLRYVLRILFQHQTTSLNTKHAYMAYDWPSN